MFGLQFTAPKLTALKTMAFQSIRNQSSISKSLPDITAKVSDKKFQQLNGEELRDQILNEEKEANANMHLVKYGVSFTFSKNSTFVTFSEYYDRQAPIEDEETLDYHSFMKQKIHLTQKMRWSVSVGALGFKNSAKQQYEANAIFARFAFNKLTDYFQNGDLRKLQKMGIDATSGNLTKAKKANTNNNENEAEEEGASEAVEENEEGIDFGKNGSNAGKSLINKKAPMYLTFKGMGPGRYPVIQTMMGPEGVVFRKYIDVINDGTATKHGGHKGKSVRRI
ncbi:hypothetical protein QEN19_004070 [Hanseniaspora menglaensis]